ncbi:ABC-F family ATP-binding cassette domain-containing protein [Akkermansiaceae bacterium]|nr:ABC-F family ATP-binding cassette domain-containing protein [Akkermansiaceae bacterium]
MLAIKNIKVEFGSRVLFENLTFSIMPKERISFAGHNGAGKSTLMKCIAGVIPPTSGEFNKPKHCKIGYLPQEGIHIKGITLWDETETAFAEVKKLQERIDYLSDQLGVIDSKSDEFMQVLEEIGELDLKLEHFDPSRIKPKIESILLGLGFSREDFERDCGEFSGGWQMRIAMAKLFLVEPEVLLLDEPTNHLDIDSQAFVENYLKAYPGAIIIISHDLGLLDMLTTRTIAFANGRAEEYAGNYSYYIRESAARREILLKQKKSQDREIEKAKAFIDRFRAKASKATQAQSRLKALEKIEIIEIDDNDAVMNFKFPNPPASGHAVSKLEDATKIYGDKTIFSEVNIEIERGERIAIVGPNGAGKSTFCRLITGQEEPTSGVFELGHNVAVSFFSQNHADELDPERTVLETVEAHASRDNATIVRNILGCFLFRGDDVFKKIGVLSGGERSRVALVSMLVQPANFLILDEPTNHLDVQSQEVLQRALSEYPGSYMIVSHNRSFLDPIVTKTLEFRPNMDPQLYHGNITYYLDKKEDERGAASKQASSVKSLAKSQTPTLAQTAAAASAQAKVKTKVTTDSNGNKLSRKEQRKLEADRRQKRNKELKPLQDQLDKIEQNIAKSEAEQLKLTEILSLPETIANNAKTLESTDLYNQQGKLLSSYLKDWESISEKIEKLESELE